jgi:hypothetical protein
MGYIRNRTVIATVYFFDDEKRVRLEKNVQKLKEKMASQELPDCIQGPIKGYNGCTTFFFGPDGSKEGWDTSNKCDIFREKFLKLISRCKHLEMAEVQIGGDDGVTKILDTTDGKMYDYDGLEDF